MEQQNARLVRELYEARERGDLEGVRSVLAEDIVWREPNVGGEHDGEHRGPEAVLEMLGDAKKRTGGTFRLFAREVVANGEHAVAMVDWAAEVGSERLEGKEVAVYRVRGGKVVEASFHQDNVDLDRRFWG